MKVAIFFWVLILVTISHADVNSSENYDTEWEEFKIDYHKIYPHESEEQYRKKIFKSNYELIKRHNENKNHQFSLKINQFGDLTIEEFKHYHLLELNADTYTKHVKGYSFDNLNQVSLPETIDLRNNGCVSTAVANQENYNKSSWAFSVVGALEGHLHRQNYSHKLSEQYLIECGKISMKNEYEDISDIREALCYIQQNGIFTEKLYSYVKLFNFSCSQEDIPKSVRFNTLKYGPIDLTLNTVKQVVYSQGPLSAYVDAFCPSFQFYHNGTYNDLCEYDFKSMKAGYQAVLIIGYGKDYWLMKNSWATSWGDKGYMKMDFKNFEIDGIAWGMDVIIDHKCANTK